ncbi:hypothetical protein [Rickettsia canadensis]|uniref:hypothetical protein n=1 Tax=Rickettsia canadensis TaxID=788 RepID=UPI001E52C2F4|nr:hypothetical protein [Rickettsia canadensis]
MLKYTFAIPLNSALNVKGFIFPRGHMSSSIVFYGWFFANIRHYLIKNNNSSDFNWYWIFVDL